MGRNGSGVEVRQTSIRLNFTLDGKPVKRTLKVNGVPMAPTQPNIKHAHRLAAEIREKIRNDAFSLVEYFPDDGTSGQQLSVAGQLDRWYDTLRMEHSTLAGYASAVKFWKTTSCDKKTVLPLGDRTLRGLKVSHILTALANRPDLSGKTVNNYVSVLREALQLAVVEKTLTENPAESVERAAWQKEPPDPFSRDEAEAIIADALKHYPEPIGNLIEWRFYTGVRTSEACGLRWGSVDLKSDYMQIREAIVRGVEKTKTKTAVSRRVMLNSQAKGALLRQAKHTRMAGEHVWLDPRYGEPWMEERAFRRSYWTPALKRLGIRYRPPNNMRHSYATMMLMAGRKPAWCAKQLGHSVEVFLRTYSKWIEGEEDDREMAELEDWLAGPAAKATKAD